MASKMSAERIEKLIMYEQLEDIQDEFEQADIELLRLQHKMTSEIYAKREKLISKIPNFWALVFEQAPPEIDQYVQLEDADVLVISLTKISVERFELPEGNPRSFSIKFEFAENPYFEDKTIEKKFWWRIGKDDFSGLVSEPVEINWKPGKDLTKGLLNLAMKIHEDEKAGNMGESDHKAQVLKIKGETSIESRSFFNFFGFRGYYITEEESRKAIKAAEEARKARKEGNEVEVTMDEDVDGDDDDDDEDDNEDDDEDDEYYDYKYDVFSPGAEVALAIAEELWPEAIRYFQEGAELAAMNKPEFCRLDNIPVEDEDKAEAEQPSKKRKA